MNTYTTQLGYVVPQEMIEQVQKEVADATGNILSLEEVLRLVDIFKGE
jgi:hypothetical protein